MMTEAGKAKKIATQERKIAELERKEKEYQKLSGVQSELRHERALLGVLRNAPTSDGKAAEPEYDGSAAAVAAAESNQPDPSTLL